MAALIIPLVGHLLVNLMNWGIFSVSVQNMLMLRWVLSAELVSPSAALHGRGRGSLIVPKTTTLPSSILPMVLEAILLVLPSYVVLPSTLPSMATIATRVHWVVPPRKVTTGHAQCALRRIHTVWASIVIMSIHRSAPVVVTVSPYAAPRSRVDSTLQTCVRAYPHRLKDPLDYSILEVLVVFLENLCYSAQ